MNRVDILARAETRDTNDIEPGAAMPAALTDSQMTHFEEQGYLVVEDVLDAELDLQPVRDEYAVLLDELCHTWVDRGILSSTYSQLQFGDRLAQVFDESGQAYYEHFDISLPQTEVTEETPMHTGPAVFRLLTNPRLLDVVEELIGPEIYSNPVQHVRIKLPEANVPAGLDSTIASAPWHQDQGVLTSDADESTILTAWLAVSDATIENGCMRVIPGSHHEGLTLHCPSSKAQPELHIPDSHVRLADAVSLPMRAGGALFMTPRTQHASLSNRSDGIRWSFDLRYNPIGQPTGRSEFPGFVARSRANPESVLNDPGEWASLWQATRSRLAHQSKPVFNRWVDSSPACA